jgi:hypothetical protein
MYKFTIESVGSTNIMMNLQKKYVREWHQTYLF